MHFALESLLFKSTSVILGKHQVHVTIHRVQEVIA